MSHEPTTPRRRGRPPDSDAEVTRARLLLAARTEFAHRGYRGASNKGIASAAGMTSAAIYNYYPSKLALYEAVLDDAFAQILPRFAAVVTPGAGPRDAMAAVLRTAVEVHHEQPDLAGFLSVFPVEMQRVEEIAELADAMTTPFVDLVVHWVSTAESRGELHEGVTVASATAMFLSCFLGMSQFAAIAPGEQLGDAVEGFLALLDGRLLR